jgi:hypothetical protein
MIFVLEAKVICFSPPILQIDNYASFFLIWEVHLNRITVLVASQTLDNSYI